MDGQIFNSLFLRQVSLVKEQSFHETVLLSWQWINMKPYESLGHTSWDTDPWSTVLSSKKLSTVCPDLSHEVAHRESSPSTAWTRLIHDLLHKDTPGSYQRLDLFMKVLWVLCPNLTDDSSTRPVTLKHSFSETWDHRIHLRVQWINDLSQWKVDRWLANHSLSSTASQGTSNIPFPWFLLLGCNSQAQEPRHGDSLHDCAIHPQALIINYGSLVDRLCPLLVRH